MTMNKKMQRKARGLARTYVRSKQRAIALLKKADAALDALTELAPIGTEVIIADLKTKVTVIDPFKGKTSTYRPAKIRRIDAEIKLLEETT
jgi:hypothetical protein